MRSAALIFGLLAGLLGCGVIAFGNLETGLSAVTALGEHRELIAKFVLYLIPNIGFLGAGLALARPRFGGFFLLLSALAWAGVAFLAGHGAVLFAALPFTFAAAGGLVALFARPREPEPEPDTSRGGGSIARNRWADDDDSDHPDNGTRYVPPGRRLGGTSDLARPAYDEPADDDGPDTDPDDDDNRPHAGRNGSRALPPPRRAVPEIPPVTDDDYLPERQARVPSRSQPVLAPGDFAVSPEDFPPPRRRGPEPLPRYREMEPYDSDEEPERRGGVLRTIVRVLNLILFIVLVGGAAAAVYFDYERGSKSLLFGNHQSDAAQLVQPPAKPKADAAAAKPAGDSPAPAEAAAANTTAAPDASATDTTAAIQPVPLAPAANADQPSPAPATTAQATPTEENSTVFNDPIKYCSTVDTLDAPDDRFTGPAIPPSVAAALHLPAGAAPRQVHWRCAGQAVYACYAASGSACNLTPTVDFMVAYCATHPDAQALPAPNGFWSCNGKRPVIPRDQKWPVDARGFYPPAWTRVADGSSG